MAESWIPYIEGNLLGTGKLNRAAIIGLQGGVWAASPNYEISDTEQKAIIGAFLDPSSAQGSGVRANGKKFMCLNANDRSVYGKTSTGGIITVKTLRCVLIAEYDSPVSPGEATKVVEDLADYLVNASF